MKDLLKEYFSFNRSERNGILFLSLLIIFLLVTQQVLPYFIPHNDFDHTPYLEDIDRFLASRIDDEPTKDSLKPRHQGEIVQRPIEMFRFDPNSIGLEKWNRLGFSDREAGQIIRYRDKGGKFRVKKDLAKMYCISEERYAVLEPFIALPDTLPARTKKHWENKTYEKKAWPKKQWPKREPVLISINRDDTLAFRKLRGIGRVLSGRIVRYREKLGGFIRKEQIAEVYGISDSLYHAIAPHLLLDTIRVKAIDINTADFKTLVRHPYIKGSLARVIIAYREQHGNYQNPDGVRETDLVDGELYLKLAPYLKAK